MPSSPDGDYTFGLQALSNASETPLVINAIELSGAVGMAIDEAFLLPITVVAADANLVLHLSADSASGSFDHLLISYEADGDHFEAQTTISVTVRPSCF